MMEVILIVPLDIRGLNEILCLSLLHFCKSAKFCDTLHKIRRVSLVELTWFVCHKQACGMTLTIRKT